MTLAYYFSVHPVFWVAGRGTISSNTHKRIGLKPLFRNGLWIASERRDVLSDRGKFVKRRVPVTVVSAAFCIFSAGVGQAGTFTFNFDQLATGIGMTGGVGVNGSIQNYMNSVLGAAGTVAVTGSNGGAITDKYYNGDGHVVNGTSGGGTCVGGGSAASINSSTSACAPTLGYTPGVGADTFLKSFSSNGQIASFTFTFSLANTVIDSVAFDYEIFPDGTCLVLDGAGSGCGGAGDPNTPDMIFSTNLGQVFHDYGTSPVTSPTSANNSWISSSETAPQKLVLGYSTNLAPGATSFTFTDWPATIGIDNFVATYHTTTTVQSVPEPGSIMLFGTIALLVCAKLRHMQKAKLHTSRLQS